MDYEFKFPDVGEGIQEGTIIKWLVKENDFVKEDQPIAEIETAKATVEIPSPKTGKIIRLGVNEGETIKVGNILAVIKIEDETKKEKELLHPEVLNKEKSETSRETSETRTENNRNIEENKELSERKENKMKENESSQKRIIASPAVRRKALELEIDLKQVKGSAENNRITMQDLIEFNATKGNKKELEEKSSETIVKIEKEKKEKVIEIKGIRKEIVRKMNLAKNIPFAVHFDEFNVTDLMKLREKEKEKIVNTGVHLTFLPFIVKAVVHALKKHEFVNSSITDDERKIILKKYYNIGIAVDTEKGLMVITIRDADKKSILEIAKEIQELSKKAREGKASVADLTGSTFTITNIGSLGGRLGVAIINYPEAAILAIGRIHSRIIKKNNELKEEFFLPLSLTFDHRIFDGANAARFMNDVGRHLTDPDLMLVDSV